MEYKNYFWVCKKKKATLYIHYPLWTRYYILLSIWTHIINMINTSCQLPYTIISVIINCTLKIISCNDVNNKTIVEEIWVFVTTAGNNIPFHLYKGVTFRLLSSFIIYLVTTVPGTNPCIWYILHHMVVLKLINIFCTSQFFYFVGVKDRITWYILLIWYCKLVRFLGVNIW